VPKSQNSSPIPFSLQSDVREQIEEMLADNIIEESYSSYVNPLTLLQREGKRVRICLDAREVNKFMTPDRAKLLPMQTLLQRFHGANFISTKQRIFTDSFGQGLKEMDGFPISKQSL
jgi:hypothetical protein